MATDTPMIHDGGNMTLSTAQDARRSTLTGSTLPGPNGSGQFLFVTQSTTVDRTVGIASTAPGTTPAKAYGVLQNTPGAGQVADVALWGVTKLVAGSTAIVRGGEIMPSSTSGGTAVPYSTGASYYRAGQAIESATVVGQVFSALIYGPGAGGGST